MDEYQPKKSAIPFLIVLGICAIVIALIMYVVLTMDQRIMM